MAFKKIKGSKYDLSTSEQKKCHSIIHTASASAAAIGAGLAQLPLADNAVITPIQITMIISLGAVFEQEITKTVAKSLLTGVITNFVGRGVAQAAWGWIPGIGNVSNAVTAAAITESVGWLCVDHFYKERYQSKHKKDELKTQKTQSWSKSQLAKSNDHEGEVLKKMSRDFLEGTKTDKVELGDLIERNTIYLSKYEDTELSQYQDKLMELIWASAE